MAPWELEELERLRTIVSGFHSVPPELLIDLYIKIGGVPRYVLETPALTLSGKRFGGDIEMVEREAYDHVKKAIDKVLHNLVHGDKDISKGPLFELYTHLANKEDVDFETKDLASNLPAENFRIPANLRKESITTTLDAAK
ncbi:hypothetical protein BGZ76_002053 [Entomortierella beljakovae]|nr:hypothetical protein BGZ76_002053 [Entomortierella beljakovae]